MPALVKFLPLLLTGFIVLSCSPKVGVVAEESPTHTDQITQWQMELNAQYKDPEHSPLPPENREAFTAHPFFEINDKYRVEARLVYPDDTEILDMPTSSGSTKTYSVWARAHFSIDGQAGSLMVLKPAGFRSVSSNYLFVPFQDETSGQQTYGGGRYINLPLPQGRPETIMIDFNRAYHPYCAYTTGYNCPIPPQENRLNLRIQAGIKLAAQHQ
ncbi:MAG: DUF1684 domain-containing protein [Bacteroidota bacterium]